MKKFAAALLMAGLLALGGFVTPANAAPKTSHDTTVTTGTTISTGTTTTVYSTQIGWWPN